VVYPLFFTGRSHVLAFLNALDLAAGTLVAWPLYRLCRLTFDPPLSATCTTLVLFSPIGWETGTSFSPVVAASLLLFLAILTARHLTWSLACVIAAALT
jgi:hypothetical protein